jgi:succinate dehydrogenase / fumarate reductase cytochrome b subunit
LFKSPEAYNQYSHALVSNPLIYLAEAGLLFIFLLHIYQGVTLTLRNRAARKAKFAVAASGPKGTSLNKKLLLVQGVVILFYVITHLLNFKFGTVYEVEYSGVKMRDLFRLVHELFQSPGYVAWYVIAVTILCFHLAHGLYASLQTLGLQHPRYTPLTKLISVAYGILVCGMFAAQPIYMFCFYKGS